ncbi:phosphopantetheine-binding protein [Brevibacillus humidisoli]|uniref:acyl carrier protein n=1 Tax=Brevibacillus humidisoli TaxID=2895522 RepID=UPI001E42B10A|nr:phosphopantetheine-binding protein [Brevibacillus humidisoli]UFJ42402.1 phosphopantetheine-binding protein [Brevibacillus humidisoli]
MKERILQLMSNEGCGLLPREQIREESRMYELGFDSLRYMELVVLLEETLEISIPDEMLEITAETTVRDIVKAVLSGHD